MFEIIIFMCFQKEMMEDDEPNLCVGFSLDDKYIVFRKTSRGRICPAPGIVTKTVVDFLSRDSSEQHVVVRIKGKDFRVVFEDPMVHRRRFFYKSVHLVRYPMTEEKIQKWELFLFQKKTFQDIKKRRGGADSLPPPLPPPPADSRRRWS